MQPYLTVTCRLPADAEERLAMALEGWPVLGCQVEGAGSEVAVTVYLDAGRVEAVAGVCDGLAALGAAELGTGHFAEQDWLAEYRRWATPRAIGRRFWVDPHPLAPTPAPDGRVHLVVEPRQAFGSGSHESTQLALLVLEDLPVPGSAVLDVGSGSGILALAARALGARWVVGFDIDVEAVFVARQIIAQQPSRLPVALFAGSTSALRQQPTFDIVLANLLPAELTPLLPVLGGSLAAGGYLAVSGLMADQRAVVEGELRALGFAVERTREQDEWVALLCTGPGPGRSGTPRGDSPATLLQ
jgi:ribosomal protein L11 methyltransferase